MVLAYENCVRLLVSFAHLALLLFVLRLLERSTSRYVASRLGWRGVLLTAWLGVPIHELGHLIVAKLLGRRIVAWSLFDPDPASGTLGYVRHAPPRRGLGHSAAGVVVGLAPLFSGGAALVALFAWMLPLDFSVRSPASDVGASLALLVASSLRDAAEAVVIWGEAIWRARSGWLPLQAYFCICVVAHMAPSRADFRGLLLPALGLLLCGLLLAIGVSWVGQRLWLPPVAYPLTVLTLLAACFLGLYRGAVALLTP